MLYMIIMPFNHCAIKFVSVATSYFFCNSLSPSSTLRIFHKNFVTQIESMEFSEFIMIGFLM